MGASHFASFCLDRLLKSPPATPRVESAWTRVLGERTQALEDAMRQHSCEASVLNDTLTTRIAVLESRLKEIDLRFGIGRGECETSELDVQVPAGPCWYI